MADRRRISRKPGRGRTRPGRTGRPLARSGHTGEQAAAEREPSRPRVTSRMIVLALVLGVLAVSYASSLRAYLDQRSHIADLKREIATSQEAINRLEEEKQRWQDPAFVAQQARERLGYVGKGERSYVVLDEKGRLLESDVALHDPQEVLVERPEAWWNDVWASVELAGSPLRKAPRPPATTIDGTQEDGPE